MNPERDLWSEDATETILAVTYFKQLKQLVQDAITLLKAHSVANPLEWEVSALQRQQQTSDWLKTAQAVLVRANGPEDGEE